MVLCVALQHNEGGLLTTASKSVALYVYVVTTTQLVSVECCGSSGQCLWSVRWKAGLFVARNLNKHRLRCRPSTCPVVEVGFMMTLNCVYLMCVSLACSAEVHR